MEWFRKTYDRLLALVILAALLVALVMLGLQAQSLKRDQDRFDGDLQQLTPRHMTAQAEGRGMLESAVGLLDSPFQSGQWASRLLVPEQRVRCVNCERPIPYSAKACGFCQKDQPETVVVTDKDHDGILDEWEEKYGLNPLDPDDAKGDPDQDGFANKEEFDFRTHPKNPDEHPPALAKVVVEKIQPISFRLIFKGTSRLAGKTVFQINLRSNERTWWPALGEEVEGFKVVEFSDNGAEGPVLTIKRGDKLIPLIKGREVPRNEYEVTLRSTIDEKRYVARVESEFELKGVKYRVNKVDMDGLRVLIHDPSRKMDVWIERQLSNLKEEQPMQSVP